MKELVVGRIYWDQDVFDPWYLVPLSIEPITFHDHARGVTVYSYEFFHGFLQRFDNTFRGDGISNFVDITDKMREDVPVELQLLSRALLA